jgi:inhibitor of KinA sporulation pathway (predicted exonuclease)
MKYHVVVDLEMCNIPKSLRTKKYRWANETIQIGAVLLNEDYEIVDDFNTYVSPQMGRISTFITNLTGIGVENVKNAPDMEQALIQFADWIPEGDVEMVSWSDSDQKQIRHELIGKGIENDRIRNLLDCWDDCQITFSEKMDSDRRYSLNEALIAAGIYQEGREHDGYFDAYNTALLYKKMKTEKDLVLSDIYSKAHEEKKEALTFSLGDLFKNLQLEMCS